MPSAWNDFVKKIYHEEKSKNGGYSFSQALKDASKRKSEMNAGSAASPAVKSGKSKRNTTLSKRVRKSAKREPN